MGRRKLGQPRVHRIIVIDQFSNEIESHELDEFGRLKDKGTTPKKPRPINFLSNNINGNIQGQINKPEINNDNQRANIHFPHAHINMPKIGINNAVTAEINHNLNQNIASVPASNENTVQNADIQKQPFNLLPNPSLNPNTDKKINPSRPIQNALKEPQNKNFYKNIPQPQILHQTQEMQILKPDEKINPNYPKPIENQVIANSIPLPIVMPTNINNRQLFNSGRPMLPTADKIAKEYNNNYFSFLTNPNSNRQPPQNINNKHFSYQSIFEFPEKPSIPLFVPIDD